MHKIPTDSRIPRPASRHAPLSAAGLALILAVAWLPSATAATPDDSAARIQQHAQMVQAHMKARLDKMAERLEIKASQQPAWGEFVKAREAMLSHHPKRPAADADAATIARTRAEFAAERARTLAMVSDATAKLQAVLDENQQKTLNQIVRRAGQRGHRGAHEGTQRHGWGHGAQHPPR